MGVNWTLVEAKMFTFTLESTHFVFNKRPIYTDDGASAKFSTTSHETDYSAVTYAPTLLFLLTTIILPVSPITMLGHVKLC